MVAKNVMNKQQRWQSRATQRGFTLIEFVVVITIVGILSVGITNLVAFGTKTYVDATSVEQVLAQSRFAMERLTRELRGAVPNSIRLKSDTNYQCVEFVPIRAALSYLQLPIRPEVPANTGLAIAGRETIQAGMMALVYPLTSSDVYRDPESPIGNLFTIKQATVTNEIAQLEFNQAVQFDESSPRERLFIVSQPVSYCFINHSGNTRLWRYSNYGINHPVQLAPAAMGNAVLMAEGITNQLTLDPAIELEQATLLNNAIVLLTPEFETLGQRFRYQQQVQVINVP